MPVLVNEESIKIKERLEGFIISVEKPIIVKSYQVKESEAIFGIEKILKDTFIKFGYRIMVYWDNIYVHSKNSMSDGTHIPYALSMEKWYNLFPKNNRPSINDIKDITPATLEVFDGVLRVNGSPL